MDVLPALLDARVDADADRPFLWCEGDTMSFGATRDKTDRVAAGLAEAGIEPADRVAILTPNRTEMLELFFACARAGAVQVPLNAFLKGEFLRYQLDDAQASTLVTDAAGLRAVLPLVDRLPELQRIVLFDDHQADVGGSARVMTYGELEASTGPVPRPALAADDLVSIVYTSGTTGLPKGCMLPHGYYSRVSRCGVDFLGLGPDDVHLTAMPLFHAAARLLVVGSALFTGGTAAIMETFRPQRLLEVAVEIGATVTGGVGAMGAALLNLAPSDLDRAHDMRLGWYVPFTPDQQQQLAERFGFADVTTELYGQTECFPAVYNHLHGTRNLASDGREAEDLEVRLVDDDENEVPVGTPGEITLRPKHRHAMFTGYWRKPEATLEAFRALWYHTGDYGRRDEEGFVYFVDRKKDALRRRGENVSSVELEIAIGGHPKIAEVAVHAVPSPLSEDDIKACLVLTEGAELTPDEAFEFFSAQLPYFAIPWYVEILSELPRNAVERVMKHLLRDRGVTETTWDLEELGLTVDRGERR